MEYIRLSSGFDVPIVGLGTWQSMPDEIERAVSAALEAGYRHIDTAFLYFNEDAIGNSLKKWFAKGRKREELFITSKLPMFGNRSSDVEPLIKLSLEKLGLDYLDMYLIHMPYGFARDPNGYTPALEPDGSPKMDFSTDLIALWKAMENQVRNGNTKSIGLSNFNERQVTEVWKSAEIKPSNLQIELHAFHQQKPLRKLCKKYNIAVTSYSSLASPASKAVFQKAYNYDLKNSPDLLGHPVVKKIATAHGKTTAQVLLHHLVKHNVIVIPKSTNPQRLRDNIQLFDFELTNAETHELDALDRGNKGRIFDFTFMKGIEDHPQYPLKDETDEKHSFWPKLCSTKKITHL